MNNLDSELLRTFLAVAETGSITEGARVIGRSQSATSLQIMRLEEVVGRELFDRTGRGVNVSDTGQRLLPVAKEVTGRLDTALRELTADGLRGKLRLAIPDDHGRAKLTRIIAGFCPVASLCRAGCQKFLERRLSRTAGKGIARSCRL